MQMLKMLLTSINGRIVLAIVMLILAGILFGIASSVRSETAGHHDEHVDRPIDASIVSLQGDDTFEGSGIAELEGRVMNNIYSHHYETTRLLERDAQLVGRIESDRNDSYSLNVKFLPSATEYSATIHVEDMTEKNFSIDISPGDES